MTTLAGNGTLGFADGTGGPNGTAEFYRPLATAVDAQGNVYIADTNNNRIRKIDTSGNVTTLAGNGSAGDVDGTTSTAEFNAPTGVAVDALGNVFVADSNNNRIREIDYLGSVITVAGNGNAGFSDGSGGPNGTAEFNNPEGIAVDAQDNIYVADTSNNSIRMISNGFVVTLAGNGTSGFADGNGVAAKFNYPEGIAVGSGGTVYVADASNNCIRKMDTSLNVTTLAGNGTQGSNDGTGGRNGTAEFVIPSGVALDTLNNVYVADFYNNRIRKIDTSGNVTTFAGNGTAGYADGTGGRNGTAEFNQPFGVATDAQGNLFVADETNNRIRKIDSQGNVTTLAGNGTYGYADGTGGPDGSAEFNAPRGVGTDAQGNVYVADFNNNRIRKIDANGNVTTLAGDGEATYGDGTGGANGTAKFNHPTGVATDAQGNAYVADYQNNRIRKIDTSGNVTTFAGNGTAGYADGAGGPHGGAEFNGPTGVAVDAQGNVYVADFDNSRIRKIDALGNTITLAGNGTPGFVDGTGGPNGTAEFSLPCAVAVDAQGNVYVADTFNSSIRKIDTNGNVTTLAGNGTPGYADGAGSSAQFLNPHGVTVDGQGNVFVADNGNARVRKIDPQGNVTTYAGNGTQANVDGPGGPNDTAEFYVPYSIAADALGNVFVGDIGDNRIRKITP